MPANVLPYARFGAEIRVTLDTTRVSIPTGDAVRAAAAAATQEGALFMQAKWAEAAHTGTTGSAAIPSRRYIAGIDAGMKYPDVDDLHAKIINRYRLAAVFEEGYKPFEMLPHLLNSPQARRNKKGQRYLIIPFRHGTPRTSESEATSERPGAEFHQRATLHSMPPEVYRVANKLTQTKVTGGYLEAGAHPNMRNRRAQLFAAKTGEYALMGMALRRRYEWGGRLAAKDIPAEMMVKVGQKELPARQLYAGMVRMQKGEGTKMTRSHYMTFRVAHEKDLGTGKWRHPGQPARPLSASVARNFAVECAKRMQVRLNFEAARMMDGGGLT